MTVDVKNACNSVSWKWKKSSLGKTDVPSYLSKLLKNYLLERMLWYGWMDEVSNIVAGVLQGLLLGLLLWNVMHKAVLILPVPKGATIIDSADDLVVGVAARQPEKVEVYACETISAIKEGLEMVQFNLAEQKTEMVLITNHRKRR